MLASLHDCLYKHKVDDDCILPYRQSGCGANVTAISAIMTVGDGEKYLACPRCQSLVLDKR